MTFMPRNLISVAMISNEAEDTSGRTSAEIERVLYARLKGFEFLDNAAGADRQEQWSIKIPKTEENAGSGSIRVRKSINLRQPGAATQYILASKLDVGNKGASAETPEPSTVDQFNIFKYLSNKGMIKDRYYFPIEATDLQWEIDCFPKQGALYHDWIKIDLEKWPRGKELPPLPFEVLELIDGSGDVADEAVKARISELYETMFLTKNNMRPLMQYEEEPDPDASAAGQQNVDDDENKQNGEGNEGGDAGSTDEDGQKKSKEKGDDGDGDDDENDDDENGKGDEGEEIVAQADGEAFSSAGQVLTSLVPIIGPLVVAIQAQRSGDQGGMETRQKTSLTIDRIDVNGRKRTDERNTGNFSLSDPDQAVDFMDLIQDACKNIVKNQKKINRIDMTLWPQKDGKSGLITLKRDKDGTVRVWNKNNPGALKWFDWSLAGKRMITLKESDVGRFKLTGRTVHVPFEGDMVEFDVGQLRAIKYTIEERDGSMETHNHNFDM